MTRAALVRALHVAALVLVSPSEDPVAAARWEPAWLEMLVAVAAVLVAIAVVWWLFLVVRLQDRWRGESRPRRRT